MPEPTIPTTGRPQHEHQTTGSPSSPADVLSTTDPTVLLARITSFLEEWERRTDDLKFFPSPARPVLLEPGVDTTRAVSDGLAWAAELLCQLKEDDAEAVDYYHISDIVTDEARWGAEELIAAADTYHPLLRDTPGYAALATALASRPTPDHPLVVFRRVWARWQSLPSRGTDGTPHPLPDPLVDHLLTEAGVDPSPDDPAATTARIPGGVPPDLAAENARLRNLLAELILETQRRTGLIRRHGCVNPEPYRAPSATA